MAVSTERHPHIAHDPQVQGGAAVIRGTRIPVRAISFYWRSGYGRERIQREYPQLSLELVDEAIAYYTQHRAEIDEELRAEADVE